MKKKKCIVNFWLVVRVIYCPRRRYSEWRWSGSWVPLKLLEHQQPSAKKAGRHAIDVQEVRLVASERAVSSACTYEYVYVSFFLGTASEINVPIPLFQPLLHCPRPHARVHMAVCFHEQIRKLVMSLVFANLNVLVLGYLMKRVLKVSRR